MVHYLLNQRAQFEREVLVKWARCDLTLCLGCQGQSVG
jgi:hypothetical protein